MSPLRTILTLSTLAALQITLGGCASTTTSADAAPQRGPLSQPLAQPMYRPVAAAALAFDPPIALQQPLPDTSRDGRAPSAFMGYEQSVTTVSTTYQRDEIRAFNGDFDRQAYTARTSVTTR